MPSGRPSKFRLDLSSGDGPCREVLLLAEDDRLAVPVDILRKVKWLAKGSEILAVLCADQSVQWLPLDSTVERIEKALGEPAGDRDRGKEVQDRRFIAIHTRYVRLRVNEDQRLFVPNDIRLCLGLPPKVAAFLTLVIHGPDVRLRRAAIEDYETAEADLQDLDLP